jgi:hypothetical protein
MFFHNRHFLATTDDSSFLEIILNKGMRGKLGINRKGEPPEAATARYYKIARNVVGYDRNSNCFNKKSFGNQGIFFILSSHGEMVAFMARVKK